MMKFPNIEEIATREVLSIHATESTQQALDRMAAADMRDIVIIHDDGRFGLLTITDIIRVRAKGDDLSIPVAELGPARLPHASAGTNLLDILQYFTGEEGYLCLVDDRGKLSGIVSYTDIIGNIDPKVMIERQRVGDIINRNVIKSAPVGTPLGEVLGQLSDVSDAVVLCDDHRPAGILTTKDAIRLIRADADFASPAGEHMHSPLDTVPHYISVKEALDYVREKRFKRIVVSNEEGKLMGVIHQRELIDIAYSKWSEMLREQAEELRELVQVLERRASALERLAVTDRLTGAYNRGELERALTEEISRCFRYGNCPFSLAIFDLDHFKQVNDRFGHLIGDEVLKEFTRLIHDRIRDVDIFARWGGEEFALLMPGTPLGGAALLAERLREAVAERRFTGVGGLTVSIGVTEHRDDEKLEPLLARADEALYRAKNGGRNRVEAAE